MFRFGSCGEEIRDKQIVCKERTRMFVGKNKDRKTILKVRVDGCLEMKGKRCDWLLVDTVENIAHFIELKGCELEHAFKQLENSIKTICAPTQNYMTGTFQKKMAYVVLSRSPATSTQIQVEKAKFKKKYKTNLTVKANQIEHLL